MFYIVVFFIVFLIAFSIRAINDSKGIPCNSGRDSVIAPLEEVDYMDGPQFERWFADLLKMLGYTGVYVTPGSGDQGIDVIAVKNGVKYGFQCKCYARDVGNTPIQEAVAGMRVYGCAIAAAVTNRHFTKGAIELAKVNSIMLIDRDSLQGMIDEANQGTQFLQRRTFQHTYLKRERKEGESMLETLDRSSLWPYCEAERIDDQFFRELPHVKLEPGMKRDIYMYPYIPDADPHSLDDTAIISIISEPFESREFAEHFAKAIEKHCCAVTEAIEEDGQYRVKARAHVYSIRSYYYDHDDNGEVQYCFANWA